MIYYFIILLAAVFFTGQFAFTRIFQQMIKPTLITSFGMLFTTAIVGGAIFFAVSGFSLQFSYHSLLWAVLFALVMVPYYTIGIKVLSLGSLAIYSMFMTLGGMLVPFLFGVFALNEPITSGKLAGTAVLTLCVVLQALPLGDKGKTSAEKSKRQKMLFFLLCIIIFFVNGSTGVIIKAHQRGENAVNEASFTSLYCILTAIISLLMLLVLSFKNRGNKTKELKKLLSPKPLLTAVVLGAFAYVGSFFEIIAADKIEASVQFPLVSGMLIFLSATLSVIAFKEKLLVKDGICVCCALVATILFAF